ncbi:Abi family protein [Lachnospiraceae bacterium ZAX-1]
MNSISNRKPLKTSDELIEIMKNNGIKFNVVSEDTAKEFLKNSNYYMKLSSYRKNYNKGKDGDGREFYENLEFAYLKELSTIDMHLRYIIIKMCLDIEHSIKVNLISDIESNPKEGGYHICKKFLEKYPWVRKSIDRCKKSYYSRDLVNKYQDDFPIWVLIEILSFGNLIQLHILYSKIYNRHTNGKLMYEVKSIRNASAHSSCIINNLNSGNTEYPSCVRKFVDTIPEIGKTMASSKLKNKAICDFVSMLYVFDKEVSSNMVKKYRYEELQDLFSNRMVRNKEYFDTNETLKTSYYFCKKVIDKFTVSTYNNDRQLLDN